MVPILSKINVTFGIAILCNMKPYRCLILFFLLSATYANGQILISLLLGDKLNSGKVEFGLDGGASFPSLTGISNSKARDNFNLGFYFDIKMKNRLFLHTGVIVKSPMGADGLAPYTLGNPSLDAVLANATVERKLGYFNVPIFLRYRFANNVFIEGGPQLGLLYKAEDDFYTTITNTNDLTYTNEVRDNYKRLDLGFTGGVGYRLLKGTGVSFGVRYYAGVIDIEKDNTGPAVFNRNFYIFGSIPIGVGRKSESKKSPN